MKRYIPLIWLAIMLVCLTGCGSNSISVDVEAAADKLLASLEFDDQLEPLADVVIGAIYDIDMSCVAQAKVYAGTGATPEEIAVFKAVDASAVPQIEKAVRARVEARRADFEKYIPEEMPKLETPPVVTKGEHVVLVISKDSQKAKTEIENLFK